MKKMIALLLCLSMLLGAAAIAEDEPIELGVVGNDQFAYTISCVAPKSFSVYHKQPDNQTLEAMLANDSPSRASYLFVIVADDEAKGAENLGDMSEEALKEQEASYQEQGMDVTYKDGANGMKFMLLQEAGSKKKTYNSIETIYNGCAIQLTLAAVEQVISPMTEKQAQTAMDFLASLTFTPADPFPKEETEEEDEEVLTATTEELLPETDEEAVKEEAPADEEPAPEPAPMLVGGWQVSDEPVNPRLTEEEQKIFDQAVAATGMEYTPVTVLATQVVAGTNYAYLCKDQNDDHEWLIVTVYRALDGHVEVLNAHVLALYSMQVAAELPGQNLVGGWALRTEDNGAVLPEEAQAAFNQAVEKADQALSPVVLLGTQLVNGQNYKVLCRDEQALYVADVYAPFTGEAELTNVEILDFLAYVTI